jgi:hypothetical protein
MFFFLLHLCARSSWCSKATCSLAKETFEPSCWFVPVERYTALSVELGRTDDAWTHPVQWAPVALSHFENGSVQVRTSICSAASCYSTFSITLPGCTEGNLLDRGLALCVFCLHRKRCLWSGTSIVCFDWRACQYGALVTQTIAYQRCLIYLGIIHDTCKPCPNLFHSFYL